MMKKKILILCGGFLFFLFLFAKVTWAADCNTVLNHWCVPTANTCEAQGGKPTSAHSCSDPATPQCCDFSDLQQLLDGLKCVVQGDSGPVSGINSAIGCIPTGDFKALVGWLLRRGFSIGGGIAFLLMIFGAFQILTSSGNPEKINNGKEMITSALAGLLMIIFSLFLLRLIGIQIFQIPGLE
jgi:hypothetical protein